MTGNPDDVPPLTPIAMRGLSQARYRVYPLVDHVADKVCAMLERHGAAHWPSTRYKDLVDLVAMLTAVSLPAFEQHDALAAEADRRGVTLPERFDVPDRDLWERGYRAEARRSARLMASTLDAALAIVTPFVDPLLTNMAAGRWDPDARKWTTT